ncbi:hypothetical protein HDU98_010502 [Podochytrium sp. JEL0797]|nr:hypothetical protein HDU98_010502 [Podochytrium sp. JEL0797]
MKGLSRPMRIFTVLAACLTTLLVAFGSHARPSLIVIPSSDSSISLQHEELPHPLPEAGLTLSDSLVHPQLFAAPLDSLPFSVPEERDTTTIIFNVFKGPTQNLKAQLTKACTQLNAHVAAVWVFAWNVPADLERGYRQAVAEANASPMCLAANTSVSFTASDFNFKFHGRFLLAPFAGSFHSKYLMIVDDDVIMTRTMAFEFISHMKVKPRLLGTAGQLRGPRNNVKPGWHNAESNAVLHSNPQRADHPTVDYLCNIWFLKTSWATSFFTRDHPLTWYTGEDIHLSYSLKKYLGISSAVVRLQEESDSEDPMKIESKSHSANHEKRVADVRNDMFRVNLGRGFAPELGGVSVHELVFVQNVECAHAFWQHVVHGRGIAAKHRMASIGGFGIIKPSCMLFTGRERTNERMDLLRHTAIEYSKFGNCELHLRPKWGSQPRAIRYFDMRLGFGVENGEYPVSTALSDLIPAFTGILNGGVDVEALERVVVVTVKGCAEGEIFKRSIELVVDMANLGVVGVGGGSGGSSGNKRIKQIEVLGVDVEV